MSSFRDRHLPPVVLEAYNSGTAMVDGINPVYLGVGAAAVMSGFLVLACGCRALPKKAKTKASGSKGRRRSKSSKSKSATVNGVPNENGSGRAVEGAAPAVPTRKGDKFNGTGPPGVSVKSNAVRGGAAGPPREALGEKPVRPKVAEKPPVVGGVLQSQGKSKRKTAADAPPVITVRP